jgi:membrane fusion protein (multidrug efflux system)
VRSARGAQQSAVGDLRSSAALIDNVSEERAPDVAAARARLAQARLDLQRTVVRAAVDGVVTNRQVQVGQRVAAGTPMMALVPIAAAYVEANFKEGQLRGVRVGQPVLLTADFYGSDVIYRGRVAGFAGGTGATLSLIPPQNATGNWIKVVQRLSVRITLDPAELAAHPLRAGLSMNVAIDTRRR